MCGKLSSYDLPKGTQKNSGKDGENIWISLTLSLALLSQDHFFSTVISINTNHVIIWLIIAPVN